MRGQAYHSRTVAKRGRYYAKQDRGCVWCRVLIRLSDDGVADRLIGIAQDPEGARVMMDEIIRETKCHS
jgi:hypothetical protein